jgi:hypothetical protein
MILKEIYLPYLISGALRLFVKNWFLSAVLLQSRENETGLTLGKASYLFIVLDKATLFVAAARYARVCETQLCALGMG